MTRGSWLGLGFAGLLLLQASCGKSTRNGPSAMNEGGSPESSVGASGGRTPRAGGSGGIDAGAPAAAAGAQGYAGEPETTVDAGAGGGPENPDEVTGKDCNGEPYSFDADRVRRCVVLAACAGQFSPLGHENDPQFTVGTCLREGPAATLFGRDRVLAGQPLPPVYPWQYDARVLDCPASVTSCGDVLACAGFRKPTSECEDGGLARCEGELAINCGSSATVTDCQRTTGQAGACRVIGSGADQRAACVVKAVCGELAGTYGCTDNKSYRCTEGGVGVGADCTQFGLMCRADGHGAGCVEAPPATTCKARDTVECAGAAMTLCTSDGRFFAQECVLGFRCSEDLGDFEGDSLHLYCRRSSCPVDYFDGCDGDDLITDFGLRLHCPDYGFATCGQQGCTN